MVSLVSTARMRRAQKVAGDAALIEGRDAAKKWQALGESNPSFQVENLTS
jgi:hypothetical protein